MTKDEIVELMHQLDEDWKKESTALREKFDDEWLQLKVMVPLMLLKEGQWGVDKASEMLGRSQTERYQHAADANVNSMKALDREISRVASDRFDLPPIQKRANTVC